MTQNGSQWWPPTLPPALGFSATARGVIALAVPPAGKSLAVMAAQCSFKHDQLRLKVITLQPENQANTTIRGSNKALWSNLGPFGINESDYCRTWPICNCRLLRVLGLRPPVVPEPCPRPGMTLRHFHENQRNRAGVVDAVRGTYRHVQFSHWTIMPDQPPARNAMRLPAAVLKRVDHRPHHGVVGPSRARPRQRRADDCRNHPGGALGQSRHRHRRTQCAK